MAMFLPACRLYCLSAMHINCHPIDSPFLTRWDQHAVARVEEDFIRHSINVRGTSREWKGRFKIEALIASARMHHV